MLGARIVQVGGRGRLLEIPEIRSFPEFLLDFFLLRGGIGLSSLSSLDNNFQFPRGTGRGLFWIFLTNLSHPSAILSLELLTNLLKKESLFRNLTLLPLAPSSYSSRLSFCSELRDPGILPSSPRGLNRRSSRSPPLIEESSSTPELPRGLDEPSLSSNVWRFERVVSSVEPLP